jgi:hypothetical protein
LADSLRPAGGVSDAGTGTGASELVEELVDDGDEDDDDETLGALASAGVVDAARAGCGGVVPAPAAAACAVAGAASPSTHAIETISRRITRG